MEHVKSSGILLQGNAFGVSFMATLSQTVMNKAKDDIIEFDSVQHNGGGYYNVTSGTFTCPVTGVYFFFIQGYATNQNPIDITLHKDDVPIITTSTIDSEYGYGGYETGLAMTILRCKKNSKVNVKISLIGTFQKLGGKRTAFAGGLLYGSRNSFNQVMFSFLYRHHSVLSRGEKSSIGRTRLGLKTPRTDEP